MTYRRNVKRYSRNSGGRLAYMEFLESRNLLSVSLAPAALTGDTLVSFGGSDPDTVVQIATFISSTKLKVNDFVLG